VLPGEQAFDIVFVEVEVVYNWFGVFVGGGGEDIDLEVFAHGVQEHLAEWADVEPDDVTVGADFDFIFLVFFHRVDQSLI